MKYWLNATGCGPQRLCLLVMFVGLQLPLTAYIHCIYHDRSTITPIVISVVFANLAIEIGATS